MTTASKKKLVIFEINDEDLNFKYNDKAYVKPFVDFLKAVGLDAELKWEHSTTVMINDVSFDIEAKSAPVYAKSSYEKKHHVRKPENRYMVLTRGYYDTKIKVAINREIDIEKVIAKINEKVDEAVSAQNMNEQRELTDKNNTIAVSTIYTAHDDIKSQVDEIKIHKGMIQLHIPNTGMVLINLDREFQQFNFYSKCSEAKGIEGLQKFMDTIAAAPEKINKVIAAVGQCQKLSAELKEWANDAYEKRFNVEKMQAYK